MNTVSKSNTNNAALVAALACMILAGSLSALALPASQVARVVETKTITAKCCVLIGPTVSLTEPATVAPVIVTWGGDYNVSGTAQLGLSVNGGPCVAYGPFVVEEPVLISGSSSITVSGTYQWVVFPSDGLVKGRNTFEVCGGGFSRSVTLNIGFNTLTVQISR
jgi:hypothetical protein